MNKTEIGILGGSFDPVHNGHLFLADYVRKACGLSKIIMIPTGKHPFKYEQKVLGADHRFNMLKLATESMEGIEVSDIEIKSPEFSYTYVTLCKLRELLGNNCKLYFIIGTDELLALDRWYKAKELLSEFAFIVGVRPNYEIEKVEDKIRMLRTSMGADIKILNLPAPDVSSTDVRYAVANNCDLNGIIPEKVSLYIKENGLYQDRQE